MTFERTNFGRNDHPPAYAHKYLLPAVVEQIQDLYQNRSVKILDIGCGNGYVTSILARLGHSVMGVDASPDEIQIARSAYPDLNFKLCSVYDAELVDVVGELVDCVISLEVVEHLFYPKKLFEQSLKMLKTGGHLIVSTPYHGYVKNFAISLVNGWDQHFNIEHDGGHIKFFSKETLARMAGNAGLRNPHFYGVGRLPWLWKSMIMIVDN